MTESDERDAQQRTSKNQTSANGEPVKPEAVNPSPSGSPGSATKNQPPITDSHAKPPQHQQQRPCRFSIRRVRLTDVLMVVFTGVLAATTIVHGRIFDRQLTVMRGQLDQMKVDSTQSDTATRQEMRAYVFAEPRGVWNIDAKSPAVGYVAIKNVGKTPAYGVREAVQITVAPYPTPEELGIPISQGGETVIHPGSGNILFREIPAHFEPSQVKKIIAKNGTDLRVYVFGKIEYADSFGTPHFTEFCHMYFGNLGGKAQYLPMQGEPCDKHNSTDRETDQSSRLGGSESN